MIKQLFSPLNLKDKVLSFYVFIKYTSLTFKFLGLMKVNLEKRFGRTKVIKCYYYVLALGRYIYWCTVVPDSIISCKCFDIYHNFSR